MKANERQDIFEFIQTIAGLWDLVFPNIQANGDLPRYIQVDILPAGNQNIGLSSASRDRGLIQFLIVAPIGEGDIKLTEQADILAASIPRGTKIGNVLIPFGSDHSPCFTNLNRRIMPLSFRYEIMR